MNPLKRISFSLPNFSLVIIYRSKYGVIVSATKSDKIMAMAAPIGIGLKVHSINPETKAIGKTAATTVNVANMVGFPTSFIAYIKACLNGNLLHLKNAGIFSA
ncbi:MAG: hypothetical protein R2788_02425 [Saprospiraceae bacterium]